MPIIIDSWEPDGDGGYYIKWTDPSQQVTAFIHATPDLIDELVAHHRTRRGAPVGNLHAARDGMHNPGLPDAATVQLFRVAYSELVDDIVDLRNRGLRHDTPYAVHQQVKTGGKAPEWAKDQTPPGYATFIEQESD